MRQTARDSARLYQLWKAADALIEATEKTPISLSDIYAVWRQPPYGVKEGLLPILALAYVLTRTDRLAIYLDGAFRPEVDEFVVDRLQQEPAALRLRKMNFGKLRSSVLEGIADMVAEFDLSGAKSEDPLSCRAPSCRLGDQPPCLDSANQYAELGCAAAAHYYQVSGGSAPLFV